MRSDMRYKVVAVAVALAVALTVVVVARFGPAGGGSALDRGLELHLPLQDDFVDRSISRHQVTVRGQVTVENGAARFRAGQGWLEAPYLALDGRPFAIALWINLAGTARTCGLLAQRDEDAENRHLHVLLSKGRPYFGFFNNDAAARRTVLGGVWNHLVFRYTGQEQDVWLNGQSILRSHSLPYSGRKGETRIGYHPGLRYLARDDCDASLRDVRVYRGLVEPETIRALYRRGFEGM
jgi:hypothetical protein